MFSPPVRVSPSGTPCGDPARRESKAIGPSFRGAKYQQPQDQEKHGMKRDRSGPAFDRLGGPPGYGDREARRRPDCAAIGGRRGWTGDRNGAPAGFAATRTRDGLADITILGSYWPRVWSGTAMWRSDRVCRPSGEQLNRHSSDYELTTSDRGHESSNPSRPGASERWPPHRWPRLPAFTNRSGRMSRSRRSKRLRVADANPGGYKGNGACDIRSARLGRPSGMRSI